MSDSGQFQLRWRGRESGPFSIEEINRKLDDHEIGMGHEIQCDDQWISLDEFFSLHKQRAATSPNPVPSIPNLSGPSVRPSAAGKTEVAPALIAKEDLPPFDVTRKPARRVPGSAGLSQVASPRHRLVYALLGILFGFTGAHNYYARHWMTGLLQLLLCVATWLLGFGIIAPWLWAMVEAFVVRKDGNGMEMD